MNKRLIALMATTILSACSLAPDAKTPDTNLPGGFKQEDVSKGEWKPAVSLEKQDRGQWWKIFGDAGLDELEKQAIEANQSLKAASARVEQARSLVRANASTFLPDVDIGGNAVRAKSAGASVAAFNPGPIQNLKPYNLYSATATASYDVDLFGRVRDNEKALSADADAQEAAYRSALLALQADVAQHYFLLQSVDAQRVLLKNTVTVRTEAQRIMQKRFDVGSAGDVDLSRTQSELAGANSDLIILDRQRAVLENALAILLGKNPSEYRFAETPMVESKPPLIPAGIPSSVLQRRPDIVAAQSAMTAANLRIGVARTAYFPDLILTATGGFQSTSLSDIFKWSGRTWALGQTAGNALFMNVFNSGRTSAQVDVAHAAYDEAVANYRQQVLVAMGDVENALTDQRLLADQSREQDIAAMATRRTTDLTQKRYDQGDVNYFEVVDAQRNMLAANRAALDTRGQRLVATVALIRALGGGWPEAEVAPAAVPTPASLSPDMVSNEVTFK